MDRLSGVSFSCFVLVLSRPGSGAECGLPVVGELGLQTDFARRLAAAARRLVMFVTGFLLKTGVDVL